jgi:AbrB family looped-hinge helix DNA binding protein
MYTSKISKKGQIVIPRQIREKLQIKPGDELIFTQVGDRVYIEKEMGDNLPKMVDILKRGKPFAPNLIQALREEWE